MPLGEVVETAWERGVVPAANVDNVPQTEDAVNGQRLYNRPTVRNQAVLVGDRVRVADDAEAGEQTPGVVGTAPMALGFLCRF